MTAPAENPTPNAKQATCDHCGLPVPKGLVDQDAERQFCCNGCRTVYETIHSCGLDRFYALRESVASDAARATTTGKGYQAFDTEKFQETHTREAAGGTRVVELRLEGVHCAACLWLVERLPDLLPGIADAKLNLRSALVRVTWQPELVALSQISKTLDRLGYPPHPARGVSAQEVRRQEERKQLVRLGVAGALAGNLMLIAIALYAADFTGIEPQYERLFRWVSGGLGGLALLWPGAVFFRGASASITARRPSLDLPIALALGFGGVAGVVNILLDRGDIYFDSLSVLIFLLLVGRWFQARQQRWADDAVGLMFSFTPATCRVVRGDQIVEIPIESLTAGDTVEVRSGDLLPADGVVTVGESSVNQALLTGESAAVAVAPEDQVFAGTQNLGSSLRVQVEAVGQGTRVGALMELVDQGVREKPPIVQFTDRAAAWFVAVVVGLATVTLGVWWLSAGLVTAIDHTVALLIVACPCALGLATPLTMAMALGIAARRNQLVKDSGAIERLSESGRMLLDKTGTLTAGRPVLTNWEGPEHVKPLIAQAERDSQHPIADALRDGLASDDGPAPGVTDINEVGDGGLQAMTDGRELQVGCPDYLVRHGIVPAGKWESLTDQHQNAGRTVVLAAIDGQVVALAALEDQVREGVSESIEELDSLGWRLSVLSGDAEGVVWRVAESVGIPESNAQGRMTPEEKLEVVRDRRAMDGVTVMVGDGVNDAAALAAADVGVAVHGGAEASLAAADVYLAQPGLAPLADLVRHAVRTMRVVRRNLLISFGYNTTAVTLAACGLITPLGAAVLMPISSATVLASAALGMREKR